MDDGPLYLVAVITPNPDTAEQAEIHLRALMAGTRMEEGCEYMELVVSDEQPGRWFMMEKFRSRTDWELHMRTSHVVEGNAALEGLLSQPTDLQFYTEK